MHNNQNNRLKNSRIIMVDALRGLALSGILLLHHVEHFDFFLKPTYYPEWLVHLDQSVWDRAFLFFSGKAFALFSLLFGFSYWIIYENAKTRGEDYHLRHLWRMVLLAGFGLVHLVFFRGDILIMYAVLGLPLVFTRYLNNFHILVIAGLFLLNPLYIYTIAAYIFGFAIYDFHLAYPQGSNAVFAGDSFFNLVKANFTYGYQTALVWSWNVGRFSTILGLFFLGVYLAKTRSFSNRPLDVWYSLLTVTLASWFALSIGNEALLNSVSEELPRKLLGSIFDTYIKLAMTFAILSTFVIVWQHNNGKVFVAKFADFGRMGLTNYLLMSVIGSILYYGWALGLYRHLGSSASIFVGLIVLYGQMKFSFYWLKYNDQGPLEKIWRKATWIGSDRSALKII